MCYEYITLNHKIEFSLKIVDDTQLMKFIKEGDFMKKCLALCTVLVSSVTFANAFSAKSLERTPIHNNQIIIKFKDAQKNAFYQKSNLSGSLVDEFNLSYGEFAVIESENKSLNQTLKQLNANPAIEYAEPNYTYRAIGQKQYDAYESLISAPTDPMYDQLWGLENTGDNEPAGNRGNSSRTGKAGADVNAQRAWGITQGSKDVVIAVIDTGIDYNHPDLVDNMWTNSAEANGRPGVDDDGNGYVDDVHGYDFANNDGDPMDGNGHGTHCAGTIAASHNNIGVAGVMKDATMVGIKFLTDEGSGSTADAIKAIDYATKINVDIMSNSWGGGGFSQALFESIERARDAGIVFTAAAGNSASDNNSTPHYPSNYDVENVISVASHTYNDVLSNFSCFGSRTVHVAAPGQNVLSTTPNDGYSVYSGTSMATPHVTGVIGLYLAQNGRSNLTDLRQMLMDTSVYKRSYDRKTISAGRADAYNFLTHTITSRPAKPDPSAWVSRTWDFESEHPYKNDVVEEKTITIPGAKFLRVVIKKYEIENRYDNLHVIDAAGNTVQSISGQGQDYQTEYVDGDTLTLRFESDASVTKWGFIVEEVQFIQ